MFFARKQKTDDIILILQQNRLRWYGHVLRKEDTDWVKSEINKTVNIILKNLQFKTAYKDDITYQHVDYTAVSC